jgi:hypothetical protein
MSWIVIGFIVFLTLSYIVISLAFPEWVGMTGKKALEIQKHQRGDAETDSDPTDSPS